MGFMIILYPPTRRNESLLVGDSFKEDNSMIASNKVQRKVPDRQHWDELARVSTLFMSPQEFLAIWDVTVQQLAQIAGTSRTTASHWFSQDGCDVRSPQPYHMFRLALIHRRWSRL